MADFEVTPTGTYAPVHRREIFEMSAGETIGAVGPNEFTDLIGKTVPAGKRALVRVDIRIRFVDA